MTETNLFIIWENAQYMKDKILEDMKKEFEILRIFKVTWSKEIFSNNLTRFYGTNLPKNSDKEKHCGNGPFYLVILNDNKVNYEDRDTSKGVQRVNTHMFDSKKKYREWTGGGHKIHGTNSEIETNHDLTLLIGRNVKDFKEEIKDKPWNGEIEEFNKNLIGAESWDSIRQVFYMLNNCTTYAVLRNYEDLFGNTYLSGHEDIDLLCKDKQDVEYLLNCKPKFKQKYRVHYYLKVQDKKIMVDLRYVGDGYYDSNWQKNMLKNRVYEDEFYHLSPEDYYYSLVYHSIIQKPMFGFDYRERLKKMSMGLFNMPIVNEEDHLKKLDDYFNKNNYEYTVPEDYSVLFNFDKVNKKVKVDKIKYLRRQFKLKKVPMYVKVIDRAYKFEKVLWTTFSEGKFKKILKEKYNIDNVERFNYDRWVRLGKYYTGMKHNQKLFIKVADKFNTHRSEIKAFKLLSNNKDDMFLNLIAYSEDEKYGFVAYKYENILTLDEALDKVEFTEDNVRAFIEFLKKALDKLNDKKIVHRDIRPQNIMVVLDDNRKIIGYKIFDFGYAVINEVDNLDFKNVYDKNTLVKLGTQFKYSVLKWDDAVSAIKLIDMVIDKSHQDYKFELEKKTIEDCVGRLQFNY